jgi:hypothetical protein
VLLKFSLRAGTDIIQYALEAVRQQSGGKAVSNMGTQYWLHRAHTLTVVKRIVTSVFLLQVKVQLVSPLLQSSQDFVTHFCLEMSRKTENLFAYNLKALDPQAVTVVIKNRKLSYTIRYLFELLKHFSQNRTFIESASVSQTSWNSVIVCKAAAYPLYQVGFPIEKMDRKVGRCLFCILGR